MEASIPTEASNTAEENQITDNDVVEQVENAGDQETAENANDAVVEEECPESESVVEASDDKPAESDNGAEEATEETVADDVNDKDDCKKEDDIQTESAVESEVENSKATEETDASDSVNDKDGKEKDDPQTESAVKVENSKEENDSIEKTDDKNSSVDEDAAKDTEKVNYTNLAPWFNEEIHHLCKKNQQLYKRAREQKNQTKLWDEFKGYQREVHQVIRKTKREYQSKNSLTDEEMAKLSTKSAAKAKEFGLLEIDVEMITDGRNLKESDVRGGSHKREHGANWVSPQEKRRRDQVMREYYKMYY